MGDQNYFLLLMVITILLPIIPSFIFFKYLPSDASMQGPFKGMKTKLGGAFAGYFVVFLVMAGLIQSQCKKPTSSYAPYEVWHIIGQAILTNGESLIPSDIAINPPNVSVSKGGTFYLEVPIIRKDGNVLNFPTISIGHHGFNSVDIPLVDHTVTSLGRIPVQIEKDLASKSIRIQPIHLNLSTPYN